MADRWESSRTSASAAKASVGAVRGLLAADQGPGAVDDLLLQLGQLHRLLAGAAALLPLLGGRGAAGGLLALAEDLLEGADLGEEHVAGGAPGVARRGRYPRPRSDRWRARRARRRAARRRPGGRPRPSSSPVPGSPRTISVGSRPASMTVTPWRTTPKSSACSAARLSSSIGETRTSCAGRVTRTSAGRFRVTLIASSVGNLLVRPSVSTSSTRVAVWVGQGQARPVDVARRRPPGERSTASSPSTSRAVATSLLSRRRRVRPVPSTAVTWRMSSTVFGSMPGVGGEGEVGVGPEDLGVVEDLDPVRLAGPAGEGDAVGEVGLDAVDPGGEGRVLEAPGHRPAGLGGRVALDDEVGLGSARTSSKRATTSRDVPRSISVSPGSTTRPVVIRFGVGGRRGAAGRAAADVEHERDDDQSRRGSRRGPARDAQSDQDGTESSQSWAPPVVEDAPEDRLLQVAAGRASASSSTAASRPVASSGCRASIRRAIRRAVAGRSRIASRATSRPVSRREADEEQGEPPAAGRRAPRAPDRQADADERPRPASRRPGPPRAGRSAAAGRPRPAPRAIRRSWRHRLRSGRSAPGEAPRQPGLDDQDRRSRPRSPIARASAALPARRSSTAAAARGRRPRPCSRAAVRTPSCSSAATSSGSVRLSAGSRLTAKGRGPSGASTV